jgi:hypothetical protein
MKVIQKVEAIGFGRRVRCSLTNPVDITQRETYKEYEITYTDAGSEEVKVMETTSLTTEGEAARTAQAWQRSTWVKGREFGFRVKSI